MAERFNEDTVRTLPAPESGNRIHYFAGSKLQGMAAPRGFGVRVTAAGAKSFVLNYRLQGREHRFTIGQYPDWSALRAVREARDLRRRIDRGDNPLDDRIVPEADKTLAEVIELFMTRHVPALRKGTVGEYDRNLRRQIIPLIGKVTIYELRRSQIVAALDTIADKHGLVQADRVLACLRKCLNWYAIRDDRFAQPIVPGMARTKPRERAGQRILSDEEIRAVWPALRGTYGDIVKVLLLTAQRRNDVAGMRRAELDGDTWVIPASRYKTKREQVLPLVGEAWRIVNAQPKLTEYVFTGRTGKTPFSGFGRAKRSLDAMTKLAPWDIHDLRRTAKVLMVRAGVRPDISERVLGHAIAGVEGVYDRHSYLAEKRDALEKLAAMIERILAPPVDNVVELRQGA